MWRSLQTGEEFQKLGFLPGTLAEILATAAGASLLVPPRVLRRASRASRRRRRVARSGAKGWSPAGGEPD